MRCRVCGCTERDCRQCVERTGGPCAWVVRGRSPLCSACVASPAARRTAAGRVFAAVAAEPGGVRAVTLPGWYGTGGVRGVVFALQDAGLVEASGRGKGLTLTLTEAGRATYSEDRR